MSVITGCNQTCLEVHGCTSMSYSSISYNQHSIKLNPPEYDVYCTGSDQVWNPRFIANDTTFMLDFVSDNKPKIAYASSFATDHIPPRFEDLYKKYLSRYNEITVREQSGVELVKKLTGKDACVVCDPTLLIKANDWFELAKDSEISFDKPYILVYFLGYMFDPRPYLYDIVNDIQHKLNLPVYYFNGGFSEMRQPNSKVFKGLGPSEFVYMISNASFLITDSFHGTSFGTIFNIPMIGIVKEKNAGDGRIATLRRRVNSEKSIVQYDSYKTNDLSFDLNDYKCDLVLLNEFREQSSILLNNMIKNA